MKKVKSVAVTLLLAILIQPLFNTPVYASSSFGYAEAVSALLIERDNGVILHEQNITARHPADALTKIMTILLAIEAIDMQRIPESEIVEMTEDAWLEITGSNHTLDILPEQRMSFKDLMYCALNGNAAEACNMIALRLSGNIDSFVAMMNKKADELGCLDTNFVNPHGQYHEDQYTSAYDMYLIYNEALNSDIFCEIAGTYRHVTTQSGNTEPRTIISSNSLLNLNGIYYYRYCLTGVGTGVGSNTYEGGYSLVASADEDGLSLISVVLGAGEIMNEDQSVTLLHYAETIRLFLWGYDNFAWRDILKTTDLLAKVPVLNGSGADFVNVRPDRSIAMLLEASVPITDFELDITIFSEAENTPLEAPISAGEVLGEVVISKDGVIYDTISLVANTSIEISPLEIVKREIVDIVNISWVRYVITGLIVLIVIYAALVIRYNVMRIKRLRKIRNAKNELMRDKKEKYTDFD